MSGFEENEISKNANGGTEISKRSLQSMLPTELLNECQIISSRIRELQENKIRVLTCHDLAEDPELNHLRDANSRNRFHKIVFVSNWQLDEFVTKLGITQDETISVIENPIKPIELVPKSKEQINLIYFLMNMDLSFILLQKYLKINSLVFVYEFLLGDACIYYYYYLLKIQLDP